jgi:hypothetical protein
MLEGGGNRKEKKEKKEENQDAVEPEDSTFIILKLALDMIHFSLRKYSN